MTARPRGHPMRCLAGIVAALFLLARPTLHSQSDFLLLRFAEYLESLVRQAGIPGLSAVIVEDEHIVWERSFGLQDVDSSLAATPLTPYHAAGLTQIFTATALLTCVESGTLSLDDPIAQYSTIVREDGATVRHVLTHTSAGTPGSRFDHDLARYSALGPVLQACTGADLRVGIAREHLHRLAMMDSVPGDDLAALERLSRSVFSSSTLRRYGDVLRRLATPYRTDEDGQAAESAYREHGLNASVGLISTVRDLARFDAALDAGALVDEALLDEAWTNPLSPDGRRLPHGLGWFVQFYNGRRVVWQFGMCASACSSMIVKLPDRKLTLILLANSDGLTAPFRLSSGDVTRSLFARLFLRLFG